MATRLVDPTSLSGGHTRNPSRPMSRLTSGSRAGMASFPQFTLLLLFTLLFFTGPAYSALINFENCLPRNVIDSEPKQLQFVPYFVDAKFNSTDSVNRLNLTVYGNVTGQSFSGDLPPMNSPDWLDPKKIDGKMIDLDPSTNILTTLFTDMRVLSYTAWKPEAGFRFCEQVVNQPCPLIPAFNANASNPAELPGFTVAHNFYSTYAMSTLTARLSVQSGQDTGASAPFLACVLARVTPALGSTLSAVFTFIPVAILIMVALSTVLAAWLSPWSSPDMYRWSSNFDRDADVTRLVTPGFGDALNYLQFAVLAGALSLRYPGFFQPVVSQSNWSVLMFNQSLASGSPGIPSLQDDVYIVNSTKGLSAMRHYSGMAKDEDVWTGMIVWLSAIIGFVSVLSMIAVACRWLHMNITRTGDAGRQNKSVPFLLGNLVRVVFNYFFLPIITLSMFQFVVSAHSPAVITVMAVLILLLIGGIAVWLIRVIFTTRPRAHLFDYLPALLTYGPLYNTYTDEAAPFAVVPLIVTFLRAIAIGAIQASGIAQLVLLVICEVLFLMSLHAFLPYIRSSSMHAHHTAISIVRLIIIFLSIAFVPSLNVSEVMKGWIGYVILVIHAVVFVFWYFLNSLQTLLEVFARLGGAGGDARGGLSKVFGVKELSKRRRNAHRASNRSILPTGNQRTSMVDHVRNSSVTSGALLAQTSTGVAGADRTSQTGDPNSPGASTPGGSQKSPFFPFASGPSQMANAHPSSAGTGQSMKAAGAGGRPLYVETMDPYYRPPRPKRLTNELDPSHRESSISRPSAFTSEGAALHSEHDQSDPDEGYTYGMSRQRLGSQSNSIGVHLPSTGKDYTIREADFYYRGQALSSTPTRKLKTGPADPTNPVINAAGWFKRFITDIGQGHMPGRQKEKGFQVVRSKPAGDLMGFEDEGEPGDGEQPRYQDEVDVPSPILAKLSNALSRAHSRQSSNPVSVGARQATVSQPGVEPREGRPYPDGDVDLSYRPPGNVPAGPSDDGSNESGPSGFVHPDHEPSLMESDAKRKGPELPRRSSKRPQSNDRISRLSFLPPLPPSTQLFDDPAQSIPESLVERTPFQVRPESSPQVSTYSGNRTPVEFYEPPSGVLNRQGPRQAARVVSEPRRNDHDRESSRLPFVGGGSLTDRSVTPLSRAESFYSIPDSDPPVVVTEPAPAPASSQASSQARATPSPSFYHRRRGVRHISPRYGDLAAPQMSNDRPLSTGTVSSFIAGNSITTPDETLGHGRTRASMPQSAELFDEDSPRFPR